MSVLFSARISTALLVVVSSRIHPALAFRSVQVLPTPGRSQWSRAFVHTSEEHDEDSRFASQTATAAVVAATAVDAAAVNTLNREPSKLSRSLTATKAHLLWQFTRDMEVLRTLRPSDPSADDSMPAALISAGSSYTRLWDQATWERHGAHPLKRYAKHVLRWPTSTTARRILPVVLLAGAWAALVSLLAASNPSVRTVLSNSGSANALTAMTAPLALLLTLRTNQSLARLLEARLAWGRLIRITGTCAGLLHAYVFPRHPGAAVHAARCLACLPWILKASVRGNHGSTEATREVLFAGLGVKSYDDDEKGITAAAVAVGRSAEKSSKGETELGPEAAGGRGASDSSETGFAEATYRFIVEQPKQPQAIMFRLRHVLAAVAEREYESRPNNAFLVPHQELEGRLQELELCVGTCDRLRSSPIPPGYSRHLSRALSLWLFFLPIGLVDMAAKSRLLISTPASVSVAMLLAYIIVGIDEIGTEIEDAFRLLPLQQLAAAAQRSAVMHTSPVGERGMPPVP